MERNQRKTLVGRVVSDKMDKTITVVVETKRNHQSMVNVLTTLRSTKHMTKTMLPKKAISFVSWKLVRFQLQNASVL